MIKVNLVIGQVNVLKAMEKVYKVENALNVVREAIKFIL